MLSPSVITCDNTSFDTLTHPYFSIPKRFTRKSRLIGLPNCGLGTKVTKPFIDKISHELGICNHQGLLTNYHPQEIILRALDWSRNME